MRPAGFGVGGRVGGRVGGQPGVDGRHTQLFLGAHGVDGGDDGRADLVQGQEGFGAALGGFGRGRVRDLVRQVPVEDFAEVVSLFGVGAHAAPHAALELQPEVFGHVLPGAAQQDRGRVGAFEVDGLVGGEQQDVAGGEFAFQFEGVEGVPAGSFDVFADHGGEPGLAGSRLGQEVGQAAVAGQALGHERLVVAGVAAFFQGQPAGFDVPVVPGDVKAVGQPFPGGGDLPGDGSVRVLQFQRGGAAQHRDRHRLGRG